jgi:hypothetical protein
VIGLSRLCFSAQSTRSSRFSHSIRLLHWPLAFAVPDECASLEATFSAGISGVRRTPMVRWRFRQRNVATRPSFSGGRPTPTR